MSLCKIPVIFIGFYTDFSTVFFKYSISNIIKILPLEAKFLHADGRTERYGETNSRFSQFYEST